MLIVALPQSTTQSIAKQYEIVSLIFIRNFFKEIAELHGIDKLAQPVARCRAGVPEPRRRTAHVPPGDDFSACGAGSGEPIGRRPSRMAEVATFISRKKIIALGLTILLLALAVRRVIEYLVEAFNVIYRNATPRPIRTRFSIPMSSWS